MPTIHSITVSKHCHAQSRNLRTVLSDPRASTGTTIAIAIRSHIECELTANDTAYSTHESDSDCRLILAPLAGCAAGPMTPNKPKICDFAQIERADLAAQSAVLVSRGLSANPTWLRAHWLPRLASMAVPALISIVAYSLMQRVPGAQSALFVGFIAAVLLVVWGIRIGNQGALFVAALFGIPLNAPRFGAPRGPLLLARAHWLERFTRQPPRGFNTVGAHVACGAIAVKRELKEICVREERAHGLLRALRKERKALLEARREFAQRAARSLAAGHASAKTCSRRAHRCSANIESLDARVLELRREIQREVVAEFMGHWRDLYTSARVSRATYESIAEQLQQPEGEPEALLPDGLDSGPGRVCVRVRMFFGRVLLTSAFIATFETSSMAWERRPPAADLVRDRAGRAEAVHELIQLIARQPRAQARRSETLPRDESRSGSSLPRSNHGPQVFPPIQRATTCRPSSTPRWRVPGHVHGESCRSRCARARRIRCSSLPRANARSACKRRSLRWRRSSCGTSRASRSPRRSRSTAARSPFTCWTSRPRSGSSSAKTRVKPSPT